MAVGDSLFPGVLGAVFTAAAAQLFVSMIAPSETVAEIRAKCGETIKEILDKEDIYDLYAILGAVEVLVGSKIYKKMAPALGLGDFGVGVSSPAGRNACELLGFEGGAVRRHYVTRGVGGRGSVD